MSRIRLNQANVIRTGQNLAGPLVRKVANETLLGAKRMARKSPAHLSGNRKRKPGQTLSESINVTAQRMSIGSIEQSVVSPKEYSMTEHEGSKAHRISGRGGKVLKFYWRQRRARSTGAIRRYRPSQASYFDHVRHPGNKKPVKFLTTPLAAAARANGFLYRSAKFR